MSTNVHDDETNADADADAGAVAAVSPPNFSILAKSCLIYSIVY